jgi:hypothetical protein
MMVDYIHISTSEPISENSLSELKTVYTATKSKDYHNSYYDWHGLEIIQGDTGSKIRGSVHQAFNSLYRTAPLDNYSQFHFVQFNAIINDLCSIINVEAKNLKLHGYEYGFNLLLDYNPSKIIHNNIISHRLVPHSNTKYNKRESSKHFIMKGNDYRIKVYDKGKQNALDENLLRFEKKIQRQRVHRNILDTLDDLTKADSWRFMKDQIVNEINKLIIIDNPDFSDRRSNPNYWANLRDEKGRGAYKREFDQLPKSKIKNHILGCTENTYMELLPQLRTPKSRSVAVA